MLSHGDTYEVINFTRVYEHYSVTFCQIHYLCLVLSSVCFTVVVCQLSPEFHTVCNCTGIIQIWLYCCAITGCIPDSFCFIKPCAFLS